VSEIQEKMFPPKDFVQQKRGKIVFATTSHHSANVIYNSNDFSTKLYPFLYI
jgi:hypothetical protein